MKTIMKKSQKRYNGARPTGKVPMFIAGRCTQGLTFDQCMESLRIRIKGLRVVKNVSK